MSVEDLEERAVDQLVDETLASSAGADVRSAAADVIARLAGDDPAGVPATWWATPLGALLLNTMRTAGQAHQPRTPQPTQTSHDDSPQPVTTRTERSIA